MVRRDELIADLYYKLLRWLIPDIPPLRHGSFVIFRLRLDSSH